MNDLVTLFGGGGFLGRYVAQALLKAGARVRIAERDPSGAYFLKPLGGLGQTQFMAADIAKPDSVRRAVAGATAVVNLVGLLKGDFQKYHVDGARTVAEAAAAAGVGALVQVSAIGADPEGASAYARSKGEGEAAVKAAFPGATIVRPSILFGPEDDFVNKFAKMIRTLPVVPVLAPDTKFQPAWVANVADAIAQAALSPDRFGGKTFELGGPDVLTMAAINAEIAGHIGAAPTFIPLSEMIGCAMASLTGWLPGAPITKDQWLMLSKDNVVAADADGFAAFGIDPAPLAAIAPRWLVQYRRSGRFGLVEKA
ncbi:complex I NDUFA9 subunit family protein [Sphingomonas naphthae]|uniref:Complex I NDUFA9 subunit family protein n=1 Tax=Sphingomonas naphthae TaxID=1813468 RepID=A0ABY7TMM7_9SPHN|nr:complex I NDUFA9 subunit family protein [Sphingomonas naphthae]WCT74205.1 complex I NDUFA9 subunit family protein [Sphingomonas naphthae]